MSETFDTAFSFVLDADPGTKFHVLSFAGSARLNGLYRFGIRALAPAGVLASMGPEELCGGTATLSLRDAGSGRPGRPEGSAWAGDWHGVITAASAGRGIGGFAAVEFALEPSMSRLRRQIQSRIHMDAASPEIVRESMVFGGMDPQGISLDLLDAYPEREFVMQHGEDLLSFVMRTLEREGITLRFDQSGGRDVAVLCDSVSRFPALTDGGSEAALDASGVSGLAPGAPALYGATLESSVPKRTVRLRDYDWRRPGKPVEAEFRVSPRGRGEIYLYGENFRTEEEGRRLASIIGEAELWRCSSLLGRCSLPGAMPGTTLSVAGSPGGSADGRWAVRAVSVSGRQSGLLSSVLGLGPDPDGANGRAGDPARGEPSGRGAAGRAGDRGGHAGDGLDVRVEMGRAELRCRPGRTAPRPPAAAPVSAWIDGAGTSGEPEMDEWGRYRVLFPFDLSERANGKASPWIRLAQPSLGAGYGQHFPLTPGCEVQVAFTDGDPDRPVITGAVADAATGSFSGSATPFVSGIGTRGGGALVFGDEPDRQNVVLSGGSGRGSISLCAGSPTTADVTADMVSQLNGTQKLLSFFGSTNTAGMLYSVRAQSGWARFITTLLTSLREIFGAGSDWAVSPAAGSGPPKDAAVLASDISAGAAFLTAALQPVVQWIYEANRAKPAIGWRGEADEGIFTLSATEEGSSGVWRTTDGDQEDASLKALATFLAVMKSVRSAEQGAITAEAGEEAAESGPQPDSASVKAANRSVRIGSSAAKVLTDLVATVKLLKSLGSVNKGRAKGLLVRNTDSYAAVVAGTHASFSAKGPLILESGGAARLGDDLRFPHARGDRRIGSLLAAEDGTLPAGGWEKASAVLLRGELVRSVGEVLSLGATGAVAVKSPGRIRVATGENQNGQAPLAVRAVDRAKSADLVKLEKGPAGFGAGVSLEALQEGAVARMCCLEPAGAVILLHGSHKGARAGKGMGSEGGRRLELSADGALVQDDKDRSLSLTAGGGAVLKGSATLSLSMNAGEAVLKAADGGNATLTLDGSGMEVDAALEVKIEGEGGNKITIGSAGFLAQSSSGVVEVKTALLK
ncbi:MAG: type VI secretion system Vgr family protein [Deltaproteobacteria bacterium]|jgi:Rhs element Vgr protein|nr:type VI secretion system Vgr family protein [Deltaproteobacteria bacterium]